MIKRYYWGRREDDSSASNMLEYDPATNSIRTIAGHLENAGRWRKLERTPDYHISTGWWWPALDPDMTLTEGL